MNDAFAVRIEHDVWRLYDGYFTQRDVEVDDHRVVGCAIDVESRPALVTLDADTGDVDLVAPTERRTVVRSTGVRSAVVDPLGTRIALLGDDDRIAVHELHAGALLGTLKLGGQP